MPPCTLPSGKFFFIPEASTLLCLMAFLISTFLALLLSEILGGTKFTLDATYRRIFFTQSEYFTMSNCVFNFNILTLVVSEILGGP